jgi:hypothetical protein
MEIFLSRSLNGVPKTQEELKGKIFRSDVISQTIGELNDRMNLNVVATNDKIKNYSCNLRRHMV